VTDFVSVYSKATGRKRLIPPHWLEDDKIGAQFAKTPLQKQADKAGELKGKDLARALEKAGLPDVGTADDKRAALEAYYAEQAVVDVQTDADTTDPLATTTDTPHGGDTEGA
jgi:hypothetical protein